MLKRAILSLIILDFPAIVHAGLLGAPTEDAVKVFEEKQIPASQESFYTSIPSAGSLAASFVDGNSNQYFASANMDYSVSTSAGVTTFHWSLTASQGGGLFSGAGGQAMLDLNISSNTYYTFTSTWNGLSTPGLPDYQARFTSPSYFVFFDHQTISNHSGYLAADGYSFTWNADVFSDLNGPDHPASAASGEFTLTLRTAVPEPNSALLIGIGTFWLAVRKTGWKNKGEKAKA